MYIELNSTPACENSAGTADLHTHTIASDGNDNLDTVCALAKQAGLSHLGISDHDVLLTQQDAAEMSAKYDLDVIPAVELNVIQTLDDRRIQQHTNLYWLPDDEPEVQQILRHNQEQPRDLYIDMMLTPLKKEGVIPSEVSLDRAHELVLAQRPKAEYHGKRDVADMLTNMGWTATRDEAMHYLSRRGNGLAYVNQAEIMDYVTLPQVMDLVHRLNKKLEHRVLSQFNHPFYHLDPHEVRPALLQFSQLKGHAVEVVYTRYGPEKQQPLYGYANEFGLLIGCGSDRHDDSREFMQAPSSIFQPLEDFHLRRG